MSAVADLQATLAKRYEHDPRVIIGVLSGGEDQAALETFWKNVWLRGPMWFDATGDYGYFAYAQPQTLLPFGRGFVVTKDKIVVLTSFTYDPDGVIAAIDELLGDG